MLDKLFTKIIRFRMQREPIALLTGWTSEDIHRYVLLFALTETAKKEKLSNRDFKRKALPLLRAMKKSNSAVYQEAITLLKDYLNEAPRKNYNTKFPDTFWPSDNKLSYAMFENRLAEEWQGIKLNKETILAKAEKDPTIIMQEGFNRIDREIHDSIVSLVLAGNEVVNPSMIYNVLTKNERAFMGDSWETRILESVDKLRKALVKIKATDWQVESYLVQGTFVKRISLNGSPADWCMQISDIPILHRWAERYKQVNSMPIKSLQTSTRKDSTTIELEAYLRNTISYFKRKYQKTRERNLTYSTIYTEMGLIEGSRLRAKQQQMRARIEKILDCWADSGFIKNYQINRASPKGKYESVTIFW